MNVFVCWSARMGLLIVHTSSVEGRKNVFVCWSAYWFVCYAHVIRGGMNGCVCW